MRFFYSNNVYSQNPGIFRPPVATRIVRVEFYNRFCCFICISVPCIVCLSSFDHDINNVWILYFYVMNIMLFWNTIIRYRDICKMDDASFYTRILSSVKTNYSQFTLFPLWRHFTYQPLGNSAHTHSKYMHQIPLPWLKWPHEGMACELSRSSVTFDNFDYAKIDGNDNHDQQIISRNQIKPECVWSRNASALYSLIQLESSLGFLEHISCQGPNKDVVRF